MNRILQRRPSPALVISLVALFVAMGGTAYALTITGANVRNNSLTGADIRDVKGGDVRNYSLTGRDIGRDRLGRVPIKEERLDASKLGKVRAAAYADGVGGAVAKRFEGFTLDAGSSRELLRQGQLVLTARCTTSGPNQLAEMRVTSTAAGAAADGAQGDASLGAGESARFVGAQAPPGVPAFDQEPSAAAIAPDGTEFLGQELYAGTSVLGLGGKCRFGGILWVG